MDEEVDVTFKLMGIAINKDRVTILITKYHVIIGINSLCMQNINNEVMTDHYFFFTISKRKARVLNVFKNKTFITLFHFIMKDIHKNKINV